LKSSEYRQNAKEGNIESTIIVSRMVISTPVITQLKTWRNHIHRQKTTATPSIEIYVPSLGIDLQAI